MNCGTYEEWYHRISKFSFVFLLRCSGIVGRMILDGTAFVAQLQRGPEVQGILGR